MYKEISGQKFNKLTAICFSHIEKGHYFWKFRCDCGKETIAEKNSVISGKTKSCGCYRKIRSKESNIIHGKRNFRLYNVWSKMKDRCYNEKSEHYNIYGGRGVKVCEEWKNNFSNFYEWAYKNGYDEKAPLMKCTIDRIDPNGIYEPCNCRWVGMKTQQRNRRNNVKVNIGGLTVPFIEACEMLEINYINARAYMYRNKETPEKTLKKYRPYRRNWSEEELLDLPKEIFMLRFNVSEEEYEMEHKKFQEM